MRNFLYILFLIVFLQMAFAQTSKKNLDFNLDFESFDEGMPLNWSKYVAPGYAIYPDTVIFQSGKQSVVIESKEENKQGFAPVTIALPQNYAGAEITLTGYIKTENVSDGYAGFWMRIDPEVAFDNMGDRGVTGTTDWTKYEVTLPLNPQKTKQIVLGAMLVGKGKAWFDNLTITIDGKDITEAEEYIKVILPAEKDTEFDAGSNITFPTLSNALTTDLELLGKLWGFLKYHHPEVGKGNYNWDYELFRMLPKYLEVKTVKQRDEVLLQWIESYGNVATCSTCKPVAEDAFLKPNLDWMNNYKLSPKLKTAIEHIYKNRHQGDHYYIGTTQYVGNPKFKNENPYDNMPYPDAGFRLLALYKYWNMIYYFFPNTYLTDKPWDNIMLEYISQFVNAESELEYELAMLKIIGDINDTHANLWAGGDKLNELRGGNRTPFRAEFVENKLIITDHYNPELMDVNELPKGTEITHIDGKAISSIIDSVRVYYPASNEPTMLRDVALNILRSPKASFELRYIVEGRQYEKTQTLYPYKDIKMYGWYRINNDEKCYKMLDNNIGYITLANIKDEDIKEIETLFRDTKGVVIDIRNYPSTFVPFVLGTYLVSDTTAFAKFTVGNINHPGEFTLTPSIKIPPAEQVYEGKIVVLLNEYSQSQAEYTAMAFRAGINTTIVGSTTAGADGNVSSIHLPGGMRTMISGIGVYYPDGGQTQRIGIVPDVEVKRTIKGVKSGKDEVLDKAIEIIMK